MFKLQIIGIILHRLSVARVGGSVSRDKHVSSKVYAIQY
jgi:hypothetical protein